MPGFVGHEYDERVDDSAVVSRFFGKHRKDEFYSKGYAELYFFAHETFYMPKCGVDGFELALRMRGIIDPISSGR